MQLLNCILFSPSWHHHSTVPLSSHNLGRKTEPEFILQKNKPSKRKFVWEKEKNKNKPNMFQNSFICYKDTKGCLGAILAFFYQWRIPNGMRFFPYEVPWLWNESCISCMGRDTVKSVSSVWVCNRSQPKEPYFRACSGTVLQRGLGMRVCWMVPAFDHCRSAVAAKPEQRGRADADQSLRGQLQRPELWEFGEFSVFFSLGIGTGQIKQAAAVTTEDGQRKEDANQKNLATEAELVFWLKLLKYKN